MFRLHFSLWYIFYLWRSIFYNFFLKIPGLSNSKNARRLKKMRMSKRLRKHLRRFRNPPSIFFSEIVGYTRENMDYKSLVWVLFWLRDTEKPAHRLCSCFCMTQAAIGFLVLLEFATRRIPKLIWLNITLRLLIAKNEEKLPSQKL